MVRYIDGVTRPESFIEPDPEASEMETETQKPTAHVCSQCRVLKQIDNFAKDNTRKVGHRCRCKECDKKYREANDIYRNAWNREYRKQNADVLNAKGREHYKNNKEKVQANHKRWREQNPDKIKNNGLIRNYGIGLYEYNRMLESQKNECKICSRELKYGKSTCVDHDHNTGKVRGILCFNCNMKLGQHEKSQEWFEKYFDKVNIYLKRNIQNGS